MKARGPQVQNRSCNDEVLFALILAAACIVGSTPGFARGGSGHAVGRGGFARNPTTLLGASPSPTPAFENRIPAPLQRPVGAEPIRRRYVAALARRSVQRSEECL